MSVFKTWQFWAVVLIKILNSAENMPVIQKMEGGKKKSLALLTCLALYLAFGAVVFKAVEEGHTAQTQQKQKVVYADLKSKGNFTWNEFQETVKQLLTIMKTSDDSKWTFYSSLYFCGSVVTTIGGSQL